MHPSARAALATAALLVVVPLAEAPAGAEAVSTGPALSVHGRLMVVPSERPGGRPAYGVALADGDIVEVRGRFGPDARTGDVFDGRLELPTSVTRMLARRPTVSDPRRAALRIVDRRSLTLRVLGTPTVTPTDRTPVASSTAHQQYVAALDNKGDLGQTDAQLLGHVSTVGSYWQHESDGAISSIGIPATVTHYATSLSTTDCGLGSDFFDVVQEAAKQFPGVSPWSGSNQLVVFVPPGCVNQNIVGMGTIGAGFASGGALVVKAGPAIDGTYAHETGHNYGFEHANARWSGSSMEYYGIYDVMGYALSGVNQLTALSTPYRVFQGITDPGEIQDVALDDQTSPVHVTATIAPRSDDTGLRSLRVVDPDTGEALYLDYRSGTGQDAGSAYLAQWGLSSGRGTVHYAPGVTITAVRDTSGVDTLVVDGSGDTSLGAGTTWSDASGDLTVHVTSLDASGADVSVDLTPPPHVIAPAPVPTITGTPRVGSPLTAHPGTWMTGVTLALQWYVGGRPIAGATGATYTPRAADLGRTVHVEVTGSRSTYDDVTRASTESSAVALGILATAKPTIRGKPVVGRTLTAKPGTWTGGTTFAYAWYADGVRISGEKGRTLLLTRAQKGSRIKVEVTGSLAGFRSASRTSAATARVR